MIVSNRSRSAAKSPRDIHLELRTFFETAKITGTDIRSFADVRVPVYENEFWTAKQRDGHSIHEVSYRACYKSQLPAFFIERFCEADDTIYDPFMGRGTTLVEAQMHFCRAIGNDVNPLSWVLAGPRLAIPAISAVEERLHELIFPSVEIEDDDLLVFFDPRTLREIYGWREYFHRRTERHEFDEVDAWLQMVAVSRLTGHSKGFFSVYTLPPNQATSVKRQRKINQDRNQKPEYRDTKALIFRKTRQLLRDPLPRGYNRGDALLLTESADSTTQIPSDSVKLIVTSPPFVDTVDYIADNWMRMWFCRVDFPSEKLWKLRSLDQWVARMTDTLRELRRVLRDDGRIAFEVGEVRNGVLLLENEIVKAGVEVGLVPDCIMINSQTFTKTANCWGVENNSKGTNSNRIVVFKKNS